MPDSLAPGLILQGRYLLDRPLGEGGMGVVWSAKHLLTEKRVALKILKVSGQEVRRRFLREARLAAAIHHPNIVDVHDVLELDTGEPFMVMDLLEGESLADRLQSQGRLSVEEIARVFLPVLSAVSAAHSMGIVHRDLKPDNIFLVTSVEGRDHVKVLDFGIAKLTSTSAMKHTSNLTQTGSVLGTPTYMAPEQVFGEKSIDHRADVWSLGVMLYEGLSGHCPVEGENVGQIFKSISQHNFGSLASRANALPRSLTDIVDQMLTLEPFARPTLREVGAVLALEGKQVSPPIDAPPFDGQPVSSPSSASFKKLTPTSTALTIAAPSPPRAGRKYAVILSLTALVLGMSYIALHGFVTSEHQPTASGSSAPLPPLANPAPSEAAPSVTAPAPSASQNQRPDSTAVVISSARAVSSNAIKPNPNGSIKEPDLARSSEPRGLGGVHVGSPY